MTRLPRAEAAALGSSRALRRVRPRPEKEIQREILRFLETVPGVVAWKTGGGAFSLSYKGKTRYVRMGKRGVSDIVGWRVSTDGIHAGPCIARFLAVEVKRPGAALRPEQQAFLEAVKEAGGIAVVAHSVMDVATALGLGMEVRNERVP